MVGWKRKIPRIYQLALLDSSSQDILIEPSFPSALVTTSLWVSLINILLYNLTVWSKVE